MDDDEEYTPRSRTKKKSPLSRLAAKKRSLLSDEDDVSGSRGSLSNRSDRRKSERHGPSYPVDANVHINDTETGYDAEDPQNQQLNSRRSVSDNTTIRVHGMNSNDEHSSVYDREITSQSNYLLKGEKRYRDPNSDGDEHKSSGISGYSKRKSSNEMNGGSHNVINVTPGEQSRLSKPHIYLSDHGFSDDDDMDTDEETGQKTSRDLGHTVDSMEEVQNSYKGVLLQNISRSDVDLRKHEYLDPKTYKMDPKRTVSLSQADVGNSLDEVNDSVGDLRPFGQPRPSTMSPTQGHRPVPGPSGLNTYDRPWSGPGLSLPQHRSTDLLSERSYASTSAVNQMTPRQARERSFLLGSAVNGGSLLGSEELDRFFPDRQMKVFVGSWNMCEMKLIPHTLDDFVHPDTLSNVCDMYVIGTQESCPNRREWEISLQESLGPHHVLFHSAAFGVLYLTVFIRKDLIWYCSVSEESNCSTRPGPSGFKTKGGVGICFTVFGTSFLFLNSHLSPHDGRMKDRIEDYKKISRTIDLPKIVKNSKAEFDDRSDVTSRFDCVFWCGDMNWRIVKERDRVKHKIGGIQAQGSGYYEDLLEHDELTQARNQEQAFIKFQEGRIKFQPTYKYDIGTDTFDTTKLRIPSYTDRILFRCKKKGGVTCLYYDSASNVKESDHRPVYGMYEVNLRPGRDNIPLSAGQFNREVWLTAMKRRALKLDVLQKVKNTKSSTICSIQ